MEIKSLGEDVRDIQLEKFKVRGNSELSLQKFQPRFLDLMIEIQSKVAELKMIFISSQNRKA